MSTPFRERNPVVVGAISLVVVIGLILLAFNADKLPIIGGGTTYYADFSEAGGLKPNDEVRIANLRQEALADGWVAELYTQTRVRPTPEVILLAVNWYLIESRNLAARKNG